MGRPTTQLTFKPLYGCMEGSGGGPLCSLLEIGGVRILLDCGWDIHFDLAVLEPLRDVLGRVDLVLISHSDLEHLGGLPYAVGRLGLNAPVYCTLPVHKMGQMGVYDAVLSREQEGDFDVISLDDVDRAFAQFKPLKFSQHLRLAGRGEGLTVTPYAAGHVIGGAFWRITWRSEDNDVVYAVSYNHQGERHLKGSALEGVVGRPSVLISDAHNALTQRHGGPKRRAAELLEVIMATVRGGGNVLIPTDASGRVLELLHLLDAHWTQHRLGGYRLALLHAMAFNTCEYAKSQLEWMSDDIGRGFDMQRVNPFELKHVRLCHSLEELDALGDAPKVVMTTDASLDFGFSKALLLRWAPRERNTVLLTSRGHGNTTARQLLAQAAGGAGSAGGGVGGTGGGIGSNAVKGGGSGCDSGGRGGAGIRIVVDVPLRVPLQGAELREHEEGEARRRRREAEEEQRLQAEEMEKGQLVADSDDEDDDDTAAAGGGGNGGSGGGGRKSSSGSGGGGGDRRGNDDEGARRAAKRRRAINASLFHRYSAPQHLMFRHHEPHVESDAYGVRESESIGWLAEKMQRHDADVDGAAAAGVAGAAVAVPTDGSDLADAAAAAATGGKTTGDRIFALDASAPASAVGALARGVSGGFGLGAPALFAAAAAAVSDVGGILAGGGIGGLGSSSPGGTGGGANNGGDEDAEDGLLRPESAFYQDVGGMLPIKVMTQKVELRVACKVAYVDMEGVSDGRSTRQILAKVAPKRLILVGASEKAAAALAADVRAAGACQQVLTPASGAEVRLPLDADVRDVLLHDRLYARLRWRTVGSHEVAYTVVRGHGSGDSGTGGGDPGVDESGGGQQQRTPPLLQADEAQGHPAVFLSHGDLKITDVLTQLRKAGLRAELQAGAAVCGGGTAVRKDEDGRLLLQGPLGDEYFRVRDVVYGQYTVV